MGFFDNPTNSKTIQCSKISSRTTTSHSFSNSQCIANVTSKQDALASDICQFLHAALFILALSTLLFALKQGFLSSFPGLTPTVVCKYLLPSKATAKGHLDQLEQNIISTKKPSFTDHEIKQDNDNPLILQTDNVMWSMFELTKKSYYDLTGKYSCIIQAENTSTSWYFMTAIAMLSQHI